MKHIIVILLFFCSCALYGQDLIVTVSGDSLKCKITEVSSDEIQFRFGQGRVISINRSEVESFQYNFEPAPGKDKGSKKPSTGKTRPTPSGKQVKGYLPFYAGLSGGTGSFGSVSVGEMKGKAPIMFGLDAAGFFNSNIGAGIKFNMANSKVDFGEAYSWNDQIIFAGAGLYGRWAKDKLELTASTSIGALMWKTSNFTEKGVVSEDKSATGLGGYFCTGINYLVSKNISIGLNLTSTLGKVKTDDDFTRNPAGAGVMVGVGFRF